MPADTTVTNETTVTLPYTEDQLNAAVEASLRRMMGSDEGLRPILAEGMSDSQDARTGILKPFREGDVKKMNIYSMIDGTASYVYESWAKEGKNAYLKRKLPNGKPAWTEDEDKAPKKPLLRHWCMLSESYGAREEIVGLGIGHVICSRKAPLRSEMDVIRHMERKHKDEYRLINETRLENQRLEDREFQRSQMSAITELVRGVKVQSGGKELTVFYCEVDGCYNVNGERQFFQSEKARDAHQRTHKKDNDA